MKLALLITAALTAAHAARSDSALSGPSGITKHLNRAAHAARSDSAPSGPSGKIKHLIIMLMENHSFDNMLGWLKRNNTAINGLTGTEYNLANPAVPSSQKIYVTDQGAYRDPDPGHDVTSTAHGIYGTTSVSSAMEHNQSSVTMGGFAQAYQHAGYSIMDCMSPQHVPVISTLAMEFALFDAFFAGMPGPTFPNRLFAMSATSHGFADNDAGQTILGWPQRSIFDSVNASNSSWRVYFEDVATPWLLNNARSEFALEQCRGMDAFAVDAAAGDLPAFTWLDPSYFDIPGANATDQHPNHDVAEGERRIKYVYDALRASPLWNESALVITYDEHGGFFDHVHTQVTGVPSPDGLPCVDCGSTPLEFTRAGVRIPFIVASPWVAKGTVVHSPSPAHAPTNTSLYDLSSIPATIHAMFGSPLLNARDAWSTPFNHVWEESGLTQPRTDCPQTMPTPPTTMPIHEGKPRDGQGPMSHLHRDLIHLVHGLTGVASTPEGSAQVLVDKGILTEGAAGLYVRSLVKDHFAAKGLAVPYTTA